MAVPSDALASYSEALDKIDSSVDTEDDLKVPTANFLKAFGGGRFEVRSEHATAVGRPDLLIRTSDGRVVGHIELKHMTKPADPRKLRDRHDKDQWEAFQALPNLIYSNGTEATLWRDGAQVGEKPVSADSDAWAELWNEFLGYTPTVDSDPRALAKTMGRRARLLRLAVGKALAEDSRGPKMPSEDAWWVDFYEAFIKQYDRKLQQDRGVFYTPAEIVDYHIRAADWALRRLLGKTRGFAGGGVETLDPACGTGTYLARLIEYVSAKTRAEQGPGAVMEAVSKTAGNLWGFELMVAPYTVARMRLAAKCWAHGVELDQSRVLLTDTLSPSGFQQTSTVFARDIAAQQERANQVKDPKTRVTVVIGNPPYDRDQSQADSAEKDKGRRLGGMIRHGDGNEPGLIETFLEKTPPEMRRQAHVIHELATYFWRWGIWKVCEQTHEGKPSPGGPGVVSYITPSAWLRSDPWAGMRHHSRARFDDIWVIDLGGDQRSARDDGENVFPVQTPVCITVAVRIGDETAAPAEVRYRKLTGTRAEKLAALSEISLDGDGWQEAPTGWTDKFLPTGESSWYQAQASVDNVLVWQSPGVQYNRAWPIALTEDVLRRRWQRLVSASTGEDGSGRSERSALFKETRDRKLDSGVKTLDGGSRPIPRTIAELNERAPDPKIVEYAYRPFDNRRAIADSRVGDMMRPDLLDKAQPSAGLLGDCHPHRSSRRRSDGDCFHPYPRQKLSSRESRNDLPSLARQRGDGRQRRRSHRQSALREVRPAGFRRTGLELLRWAARHRGLPGAVGRPDGHHAQASHSLPGIP